MYVPSIHLTDELLIIIQQFFEISNADGFFRKNWPRAREGGAPGQGTWEALPSLARPYGRATAGPDTGASAVSARVERAFFFHNLCIIGLSIPGMRL